MKKITCKIEKKNGTVDILSPSVGIFHRILNDGDYLCRGSYIGSLYLLKSRIKLYIPDDISGRANIEINSMREIRVGYGDTLLKVFPTENISVTNNLQKNRADKNKEPEGIIIRSFITGIFYGKATPDSKPFVKIGSKVKRGDTLGLIEVMKSFSRIIFEESDDFKSGVIEEIFVNNDTEIKMGDPLFRISVK